MFLMDKSIASLEEAVTREVKRADKWQERALKAELAFRHLEEMVAKLEAKKITIETVAEQASWMLTQLEKEMK
jgi:hypothetical protein